MNNSANRIRSGSTNKTEDKKGVLKNSAKEKSKSGERSANKPRSLSKKSSQESLSGDENRKTHLSKKSSGRMNKTKSSSKTKRSSKSPKDVNTKGPNWIEDLSNQGMAIISVTVFQSKFFY
jgi:flagellar hook-length control protein FliK